MQQELRRRLRKKGHIIFQNEALGRSKGGFTTKLHLACDGKGRLLAAMLTPGQQHDCTQLEPLLDAICVRRTGPGRPRKKPDYLLADRGYSYLKYRKILRYRGIRHSIPERRDQVKQRKSKPGRPLHFDKDRYKQRNVVERFINRLKHWRGIATRFEKRATYFYAAICIAAVVDWLK
jgi:transposase